MTCGLHWTMVDTVLAEGRDQYSNYCECRNTILHILPCGRTSPYSIWATGICLTDGNPVSHKSRCHKGSYGHACDNEIQHGLHN
ncbi:hypothetical protein XENTR_v10011963 [Xenopus tropicalis]|nr:hypothetical protein XENTR_v10011963 [Xenopus tropicalis]